MAHIDTLEHTVGGNTNPPLPKVITDGLDTETHTSSSRARARAWCCTLNNYTREEHVKLMDYMKGCKHYVLGEEVGEEGTPHLQGYLYAKNAVKFSTLKRIAPRAHWEKAKGSASANKAYCTKDGKYETNIPMTRKELVLKDEYNGGAPVWREWQQSVIDLIDTKPDGRSIHWFWEPEGNVGKSYLSKYLSLDDCCVIGAGKKADVFHQIAKKMEGDEFWYPKVVVVDVPRSNLEYVHMGTLEGLVNGHVYSGKYEGAECNFPFPHVICFANEAPRLETMSLDRWKVTRIGGGAVDVEVSTVMEYREGCPL